MKKTWKRGAAWLTALALMLSLVPAVLAAEKITLPNGDFESGTTGWTLTGYGMVASDDYAEDTSNHFLKLWLSDSAESTGIASYTTGTLEAGTYYFTYDLEMGPNANATFTHTIKVGSEEEARVSEGIVSAATGWDNWATYTTSTFTLDDSSAVTFTLTGVEPSGWWGSLDNLKLYKVATSEGGGDENQEGYVVKVTPSETSVETGEQFTLTATVTNNGKTLDLGSGYNLWWWADDGGWVAPSGGSSADNVTFSDKTSGTALSEEITIDTAGTYYIVAELKDSGRLATAVATITVTDPVPPVEPVPAKIYVPYVTNDPDFIRGTDVSSLLSILNSGAHYYDDKGNMLGTAGNVDSQGKAFMELLAASGVNWVRLRVWNNPFDSAGKGYGGGNNDLEAAKKMGKWATDAGLKVLIDFHYSDFWADPGKQQAPKAWSSMSVSEKAAAITSFTTESLNTLISAGVDVAMVQVGNETNGFFCGEKDWANIATLFKAGSAAVRTVSKDILVALHFTNPEASGRQTGYAKTLSDQGVDYDVFATSYYPYWHGSLSNLTSVLSSIATTYNKKVMVAETSWAWTLADGDGWDNTVRVGNNDTGANNNWSFTVQGQALEFADVAKAVKNVGENGLGLFYWENAWIPVAYAYEEDGTTLKESVLTSNKAAWETYGSGWASSYASGYDPDDAGKWYGGSAVDNQAMFDFTGKALESLKVFEYMKTGTTTAKKIDIAENPAISVYIGDSSAESSVTALLNQKVNVTYNNGDKGSFSVTWGDTSVVDYNTLGTYVINGTIHYTSTTIPAVENDAGTAATFPVTCTVTVSPENLLKNPGFESGNTGYTLSNWKGSIKTDASNTHSGSYCLHFYNDTAFSNATAEQSITLQPGTYHFTLYAQGGDMGTNYTYIYVKYGAEELTKDFTLDGWKNWKTPEIVFQVTEETQVTVGVSVSAGAGAWGSFDDWYLYAEPPCEHSAPEHTDAKAPTCAEDGNIEYWYCPDCGQYFKDASLTQAITEDKTVAPATGNHTPEHVAAKEPASCAEPGNIEYWKCLVCGKFFDSQDCTHEISEEETVKPAAHSPDHVDAKEPTSCTEPGNIEYWKCSVCGKFFDGQDCANEISAAETVKTAPHELEEVPFKDSTTSATGNKQHWKCGVCGKLFLDEHGENETTLDAVTIAKKSSGSTRPSKPNTSTSPATPDVSTGETEQGDLTTTAKPSASTSGTSAKAEVTDAMGSEMVKQAEKNSSDTVVVSPKVQEDVTETQVTIPGNTLGQLADKTDADLRIETPAGDVTIPNGVLSELSEGAVTVTTRRDEEAVSVEITVDGERVESVSSKLIVETKGEGYGPGTVAVIVHEDGTEEIIPTSFVDSQSGGMIIPVNGSITVKIVDNSQTFEDVDSDAWHHDSVEFSASHGLMIGTSETEFSPDEKTTRGMLVTVLYRLAGQPEAGALSFDDVEDDLWYSGAIAWAAANGIVNGNDTGNFAPDDVVTREQMIAIFYRYAERIGAVKSGAYAEPDFSDAGAISDYAKDSVNWAVEVGIINGMDDGRLDPQGTATRAQVAAVFQRLCVKFYPYI